MDFSDNLKKARLNIGYTQQQIADMMGITKSTYCGYETGKRQPDVFKIKSLAKILNVTGDYLLFGTDNEFNQSKYTKREQSLINDFRDLSEQGQDYILQTMDMVKDKYKKDTTKPSKSVSDDVFEDLKQVSLQMSINTK